MDKRKIIIPKDELYQKYIVENMSRAEVASFFNVKERTIARRLEEYGIKKDTKDIYSNIKKSTFEHYGVEHPSKSKKLREKAKKVMKERYGVEYTAQSDELRRKMQQTTSKRYGKSNYVETNVFKNVIKQKCLKEYGVEYYCQTPQCVKSLEEAVGHSKPEQEFAEILKKYNIDFEQEYSIRGFKYDFKVGSYLLEINPSVTHNSNFGLFKNEPKNKNYHISKSIVASENGFNCVHIFDWDDKEKIVRLFLTKKDRIFARNCEVKEISKEEASIFINENHLQGYAKDENRIGLVQNGELVSIMTFGTPRYNKKYQYELIRYCSSKNVVGGAEKLLSYFVKKYKPKSIVSYCDVSKFSGSTYHKLGFDLIATSKPSKHWVNIKTGQHITDNLLRKEGFDHLFKTNYGKGTSNEQLMLEHGFVVVYDCGQKTYVKAYS